MRQLSTVLPALVSAALLSACTAPVGSTPTATTAGPLFQTLSTEAASKNTRIYVTNVFPRNSGGSVAYFAIGGGKPNTIIRRGLRYPSGIAFSKSGKIYVTNYDAGAVFTYNPDGTQTTPTITGLSNPIGITVDAAGKIYVTNYAGGSLGGGYIATFKPDGTPTTPTIVDGISSPWGIAVDAKGKIYVANYGGQNITTYTSKGKQTTPTITIEDTVTGIAVDKHGKIYVNENSLNMLQTFTPAGVQTTPTITTGLDDNQGLAVDASSGKIYVVNIGNNTMTTYTSQGKPANPTIRHLRGPIGIALH